MAQSEGNFAIIGVGIDLADVARIESLLEKYGDAFLEKTFAECEIKYCKKCANPALHFAARFAAKEAAVKALGTGFSGGITPKSVWIENDALGAPTARFDAAVEKRMAALNAKNMHVSLTHLKDYAQAIAILSR